MYRGPNFKAQQKNEVVLTFFRKHWIVLLPKTIGFILYNIFLLILLYLLKQPYVINYLYESGLDQVSIDWLVLLFVLGSAWYISSYFLKIFNYFSNIKIITNCRIVELNRTVFFRNNMESIDIHRVVDVQFKQHGIIRSILNYGELILVMVSTDKPRTIRSVPNVEYYARKVMHAKRKYINDRLKSKTNKTPEKK